jgi:citrate lyase subunit beta/citryl-CoA lyase
VHRSYLFVPANRPDRYAKACATRAHAIIVDLEDAVPADEKSVARTLLAQWLPAAPRPVLVRINAADTEWFEGDLGVCAARNVAGVLLPKCERVDDVRRIADACADVPIHPLIETARGLWDALTVARAPGVRSLLFGSLDFQADVGTSDDELLYARSHLVVASRVAGIDAPIDGVTQAIDDPELLRRDTRRSRELGFGGKACIHPKQVDIVNDCFAPSADDVAWAQAVVDAFAKAAGSAVQVDGRMVDRPVLLKAQAILAERASVAHR